MTDERFSVAIIYPDETHEYVARNVGVPEAVHIARDYTRRPAATIGIITRVMITDADDFCCFLWRFGEGVVFPPRAAAALAGGKEL